MRKRKLAVGFGLLLCTATTVPALAQPAGSKDYPPACVSVSQAQSEKAHDLYKAGKVQYDDNNWDAAIGTFRDAYSRDCTKHELLVIISRAYELKGDRAEAIRALETYLERDPKSGEADTYRRRIAKLKEELAKAPPAATTAAPPPSSTGAPPPPPPGGESRGHTPYPWVVVGIGGVAVLAGVVVIATTPSFPSGCDKEKGTCTRTADDTDQSFQDRQEQAGRSQDQPGIGAIVIGAGVGVMAIGLLWHFLEPTGPADSSSAKTGPKLTPSVSPGYAGLTLGSSF